jgi:hypothetical protein
VGATIQHTSARVVSVWPVHLVGGGVNKTTNVATHLYQFFCLFFFQVFVVVAISFLSFSIRERVTQTHDLYTNGVSSRVLDFAHTFLLLVSFL